MASTYYVLAAVLGLVLVTRLAFAAGRSPQGPFPAGPPALPLLGHLHQMPSSRAFLTFAKWARTYGAESDGLVGLRLGPSGRAVVLSKWQHVRDLLEVRGQTYSSRPSVPIVSYVIPPPGPDLHLVFMRYGATWRRARKTITDFLRDSEVEKLLPLQDAESTQMMWELLSSADGEPGRYHDIIKRYFGAVVLASVFGLRGGDYGQESRLRRFFAVQDEWAGIVSLGATPPLDVFPWLRYVPERWTPWRGWKQRAAFLRERQSSLYHELCAETRERLKAGKADECFLAGLLREQESVAKLGNEKRILTQLELDYIGGFLMEGGADTTASAFETVVLAMATHPDVQKVAQEEVDRVFGSDKMPHSADGAQLPFLKACFLETLRWRPGFAAGVPHATTADDTYRGYFIPKGTTIIANTWAISHDPDEFEDPDSFNPSRYLANRFGIKNVAPEDSNSGEKAVSVSRKQTYAFGAGRRMCAGQKMAENSMMMTMAKLVWAFDVVPGDGEMLDTSMETAFKDALLAGPKKFNVKFVVRDGKKGDLIRQQWEKADVFLSRYK